MSKRDNEKLMLAEQVMEIRYLPSGSFLDVRGYVADYIRDSGFLPHWKIEANVVQFRDQSDKVLKEGAFAGYRNAGYLSYDPPTRNFFVDRGLLFWRTLEKNQHYKIPSIERFGTRTKVFLPSLKTFDQINRSVFETVYTEKARAVFNMKETDVQFVIEGKEEEFEVRLCCGPMHEEEVSQHLPFESEEFSKPGLFMDIDFYRTSSLVAQDIPRLLRSVVELTWKKVENLAEVIGV